MRRLRISFALSPSIYPRHLPFIIGIFSLSTHAGGAKRDCEEWLETEVANVAPKDIVIPPKLRFSFAYYTENLNSDFRRSDLEARIEADDPHFKTLLKLGAQIEKSKKTARLVFPDFPEIFEKYNSRIRKLIRRGIVTENEVLRPALPFTHDRTKKILLIRPGIDDFPDQKEWSLITKGSELTLDEWSKAISEGKVLFQLEMADHDLSHLTEYLSDPGKMAQVRRFYRRVVEGEIELSESSGKDFMRHVRSKKPFAPTKTYARLFAVEEALSLPNIDRSTKLMKLVPEVLADGPLPTLKALTEKLFLESGSPKDFSVTLNEFVKSAEPLLKRVGGGMRDTYNLLRNGYAELPIPKPPQYSGESLEKIEIYGRNRAIFSESLHSRLEELRRIAGILGTKTLLERASPDTRTALIRHAAEKLASLKLAFAGAVQSGVTPEILMKELAEGHTGPGTASYRYFSAFTKHGEVFNWAFVDSAADAK